MGNGVRGRGRVALILPNYADFPGFLVICWSFWRVFTLLSALSLGTVDVLPDFPIFSEFLGDILGSPCLFWLIFHHFWTILDHFFGRKKSIFRLNMPK